MLSKQVLLEGAVGRIQRQETLGSRAGMQRGQFLTAKRSLFLSYQMLKTQASITPWKIKHNLRNLK